MQSKEKNAKSICHEIKIEQVVPIPAIVIAEIAEVSESLVKKIDTGKRNPTSRKGKKIQMARQLMSQAAKHSQKEVKRFIDNMEANGLFD